MSAAQRRAARELAQLESARRIRMGRAAMLSAQLAQLEATGIPVRRVPDPWGDAR